MNATSYRRGDRVRLVACYDIHSPLPPSTIGTVRRVDDAGTVHVHWDDGSTLGVIPGVDHIERAEEERT